MSTDLHSAGKVPGTCTEIRDYWRGWNVESSGKRSWHPIGRGHPAAWCWEHAGLRWVLPLRGPSLPCPQLNLCVARWTDPYNRTWTEGTLQGRNHRRHRRIKQQLGRMTVDYRNKPAGYEGKEFNSLVQEWKQVTKANKTLFPHLVWMQHNFWLNLKRQNGH